MLSKAHKNLLNNIDLHRNLTLTTKIRLKKRLEQKSIVILKASKNLS
jgi:hypothetical protein